MALKFCDILDVGYLNFELLKQWQSTIGMLVAIYISC